MLTASQTVVDPARPDAETSVSVRAAALRPALLTGGIDRPYVFGLAMALRAKGVSVEVIGGAEVDSPEMHSTPGIQFFDFYGDPRQTAGWWGKAARVLGSYLKILLYAATARPGIFHLLWNNKFHVFDRTLLMMVYKVAGKKIVFTAHNVNAGKRDGNDSALNRLTLKIQYRLADHIFVHTEKMKGELLGEYGVRDDAVTVIPFGINNSVPDTALTPAEARRKLGLDSTEKVVLFFGAIRPYKGLEYLVEAFQRVAASRPDYRLVIAGESKRGSEEYWLDIQKSIENHPTRNQVIQKIEFVPDGETELYFKAADVTVLSYTEVFQSGVLFLAYSFVLPVIASDVGSFRDDIIPGETGLVCRACDTDDLATAMEQYFASDLFRDLDRHRPRIRDYANARNSWGLVGELTRDVYFELSRT
jgi:D-inositol-3-phosphate glycosyltransferase